MWGSTLSLSQHATLIAAYFDWLRMQACWLALWRERHLGRELRQALHPLRKPKRRGNHREEHNRMTEGRVRSVSIHGWGALCWLPILRRGVLGVTCWHERPRQGTQTGAGRPSGRRVEGQMVPSVWERTPSKACPEDVIVYDPKVKPRRALP